MSDDNFEFRAMLHPIISKHAYPKFLNGYYRNAILDALIAVFDLLRERTGVDLDGTELVGRVFSLSDPMLILSELDTESARNDQKGFMQLLQGAYSSMRNPRAHSITEDIEALYAARYLVVASVLAQRIECAFIGNLLRFDGLYVNTTKDHNGIREYLRFYGDGKVLKSSLSISRDDFTDLPLIMNDLTRERAEKYDYPRGTYIRNGNKIKLVTNSEGDDVEYEGNIRGGNLDLSLRNRYRGFHGASTFKFHKVQMPVGYGN